MPIPHSNHRRRIAVIGGGISGLAAAHRLTELDPSAEVILLEAGDRLGGILATERRDGFLLEFGADSFITNVPWAIDLCRRIGLADRLIETNTSHRRALVVRNGQLYPVPEGFLLMEPSALMPLLRSPLLSWRGKLRVLCEYFIPSRRTEGDESLASFARRRLGREAFERLVQPLVAGIYTADPEKLSLQATLPRFLAMEQHDGGLIRGTRRRKRAASAGESGVRYSMFVAPREGMQTLATAIAAKLPADAVRLRSRVARLEPVEPRQWHVHIEGADVPLVCNAVIVATPAHSAARVADSFDAALAESLRAIPYAGTAVALLGYDDRQITRALDGFGFVVPEIEKRPILAASFSSVKFAERAPAGKTLVRVFMGGAMRPETLAASDEELLQIATSELSELIGARGEPCLAQVARWPIAMPQYHLGHLERVAAILACTRRHANLEIAGNAYTGVGVPQAIHSGEQAAERLLCADAVQESAAKFDTT